MLITSPEAEQFWPGQSAPLAEMSGASTEVVEFAAAEGAGWHCQPMAWALTGQRMFDWLDETLAGQS